MNDDKGLKIKLPSDFDPYIKCDYDEKEKRKKLTIFFGKNNFDHIEFKLKTSQNIDENIGLFSSLTKLQKLGIIFLACCIKSGRIPLIQGETASGKSYLMNIFSRIFGQDMILYQITSNSGMSIITGQDIIKTDINDEKQKELKKAYKNIKKLINNENRKFEKIKKMNIILY